MAHYGSLHTPMPAPYNAVRVRRPRAIKDILSDLGERKNNIRQRILTNLDQQQYQTKVQQPLADLDTAVSSASKSMRARSCIHVATNTNQEQAGQQCIGGGVNRIDVGVGMNRDQEEDMCRLRMSLHMDDDTPMGQSRNKSRHVKHSSLLCLHSPSTHKQQHQERQHKQAKHQQRQHQQVKHQQRQHQDKRQQKRQQGELPLLVRKPRQQQQSPLRSRLKASKLQQLLMDVPINLTERSPTHITPLLQQLNLTNPFFSRLHPHIAATLLAGSPLMWLHKNQLLYRHGSAASQLYIILMGKVQVYRIHKGIRKLCKICIAGESIGEQSIFEGRILQSARGLSRAFVMELALDKLQSLRLSSVEIGLRLQWSQLQILLKRNYICKNWLRNSQARIQ